MYTYIIHIFLYIKYIKDIFRYIYIFMLFLVSRKALKNNVIIQNSLAEEKSFLKSQRKAIFTGGWVLWSSYLLLGWFEAQTAL